MVRDANGYTPLLKAASLCRTDMAKYLVEKRGSIQDTRILGATRQEKRHNFTCATTWKSTYTRWS